MREPLNYIIRRLKAQCVKKPMGRGLREILRIFHARNERSNRAVHERLFIFSALFCSLPLSLLFVQISPPRVESSKKNRNLQPRSEICLFYFSYLALSSVLHVNRARAGACVRVCVCVSFDFLVPIMGANNAVSCNAENPWIA